jgi:DNA-binding transcriptional ArsR family regulator
MADLLPSSPDVDPPEEPRVVGVDSDDAEDLLAALSSGTARGILAALHEEPSPPSRVAERVDTSLQNVQYHLGRLEDAGVVEVADTVYSEKGREMKVYAPADRALVVVAGPREESDGLRSALSRLLGGVGALALGSVVVDRAARRFGLGPAAPPTERGAAGGTGGGAGGDSGTSGESTEADAAGGADGAADGTATPSGGDDAGVAAVGNESTTSTPASTEADGLGTLSEPSATGTATGSPASTRTPTPTPSDGADLATATEAPRETATATATGVGTPTPTATETPTPAPTPTSTPAATTTPTPTPSPDATSTVVETTGAVATTGEPTTPVAALASSPGALFFLGGVTVLLAWFALVAYRART